MRLDEFENVQHGVPRDALVDVWGTQILFHSIRLKKMVINMWNTTLYVHYLPRYQGGPKYNLYKKYFKTKKKNKNPTAIYEYL